MSENYPYNHKLTPQVCHFCQRRREIAYYCENCGASCCSDCLANEKVETFICQECNSKNIEESGNKRICEECGSENVIKTNQNIKSCPRCSSHRIVNIFEKKEDLEQRFLELIKNTRMLIKPFRNLINALHLTRDNIKKARDPPIKCYHFPKMESELVSIFKLLEYLESTLLEKINIYFHHLALNKDYFFDIYSQPNDNVRIIEGILDNLHESHKSIESFIEKKIEKIEEELNSIKKNLKFINKITDFFLEYKRFINLAEDEKPIYAIHAKLSNSHTNKGVLQRQKGVLFITNYDLSFVHEYGVIKNKQNLIFKAPVEDIIRIKEIGKLFKKLYIEFAYGNYELTLPNDAISRVIEYILLARNFDETSIYDKKSWQKLTNIDIDLSSLKNFIEEGINSFFSLRCNINSEKNQIKIQNSQHINQFQSYDGDSNISPNYYNNYQNSNHFDSNFNNQRNFFSSNDKPPFYQNNPNACNYFPSNNYNDKGGFENRFDLQQFKNCPSRYHNYNKNPNSNKEEKSFLMKKLEQAQKEYGQPFLNQVNRAANDFMNFRSLNRSSQSWVNTPHINSDFPDYNRNHFSEYFQNERFPSNYQGRSDFEFNSYEKELEDLQEKYNKLEGERYSILETMKKFENKFDEGEITRKDFMKSHLSLKRDLFNVNTKIKNLRLKEEFRW